MKGKTALVDRYKRFLGLPEWAVITAPMIRKHWRLETRLAGEILRSSKDNRAETVRRCYERFYRELNWLNDPAFTQNAPPISQREESVIFLVGNPPKRILEVGSGNGELIDCLSRMGHECVGTDINKKRFKTRKNPNLELREQNGVMLQNLSKSDAFDAVLSLNVLEHFHPDDVEDHLKDVYRSLKGGGEYILKTPHRFFGPHGIERIFGVSSNRGLHLKEYTYGDVREMAERSGFLDYQAVLLIPMPIRRMLKRVKWDIIQKSRAYMDYLIWIERMILKIHDGRNRTRMAMGFRFLMFPRQVFVVLKK